MTIEHARGRALLSYCVFFRYKICRKSRLRSAVSWARSSRSFGIRGRSVTYSQDGNNTRDQTGKVEHVAVTVVAAI